MKFKKINGLWHIRTYYYKSDKETSQSWFPIKQWFYNESTWMIYMFLLGMIAGMLIISLINY